jgi:hypothetical protein
MTQENNYCFETREAKVAWKLPRAKASTESTQYVYMSIASSTKEPKEKTWQSI